jgi:hypothetical protein
MKTKVCALSDAELVAGLNALVVEEQRLSAAMLARRAPRPDAPEKGRGQGMRPRGGDRYWMPKPPRRMKCCGDTDRTGSVRPSSAPPGRP